MLLALDISTSCIGYSVFNEKDILIEMNYIQLTEKSGEAKRTLFDKFNIFKEKISHLLKIGINYIVIEEPLKKFEGKYSSADTIATLNFFNGMISSFLFNNVGIEPVYYNVKSARKVVFPDVIIKKDGSSAKHQIWERVMEKEPQINWIYGLRSRKLLKENYDMADSYVVGKCFIITKNNQKNL